ncbi:MAG: flagellin FliC [Candidatus Hydrogenedentes bacterium]|nr:flagellin FliC [Candidatus Hydrogenedentota bacterium]
MGLRINTNIAGLRTARILRQSTNALNKSLERLSSGLRINRAGDDAAGLAIAEGFRSVAAGARVAQRNAQDGVNLVQTAEGALSETVNILQRMRELAVQAANGTNSVQNRVDLNLEVQALKLQLDDIGNNTEFNGLPILDGTVPTIVLQVGAQVGQTITVTLTSAATSLGLLVNGIAVTGVDNTLPNIAILAIDIALTTVNGMRSTLGAAQNRLEFTISVLGIQEENSRSSESFIRDADIALETIEFTRNQILVSAGTSVLAQANIVPQTALQLLGG